MKISLSLVALASLALVGCGSKDSTASGPMDTNRPPSPAPPPGNSMATPPPTSAPATTTGG